MNTKSELENLVNLFYKIISGKKNENRDWDLFKTIFIPDARLIIINHLADSNRTTTYSINEYIFRLKSFLAENDFFEYGENYRIEVYRNIACAYSEYKAKRNEQDQEFIKKGINLVHFAHDGKKWFISSMQWEDNEL